MAGIQSVNQNACSVIHKILRLAEVTCYSAFGNASMTSHYWENGRSPNKPCISSQPQHFYNLRVTQKKSDGSISASGSAGPGFDPRRGSKFSFENFQPWG